MFLRRRATTIGHVLYVVVGTPLTIALRRRVAPSFARPDPRADTYWVESD